MASPPVGQPPPGVVQPDPTPPITTTPLNTNPNTSYAHIMKPQVQKVDFDQRLCRTVYYNQGQATLKWKTSEVKRSLIKEQLQYAVLGKFSHGRPDLENLRKLIPGQCGIKASAVGTPLKVDTATLNKTRPSCARVKVELDLLAKHPAKVLINEEDDETGEITSFWADIDYDYVPLYCKSCKLQGHNETSCKVVHPELWEEPKNSGNKVESVVRDKPAPAPSAPPLRILTSGKVVGNVRNEEEWNEAKSKKNRKGNDNAQEKKTVPKPSNNLALVQTGNNQFAALQEGETLEGGDLGDKALVVAKDSVQHANDQKGEISAKKGAKKSAAKNGASNKKSAGKGVVDMPISTVDWVKQTWATKKRQNDGNQLAKSQPQQQKKGETVGVTVSQGGLVTEAVPVSAVPVPLNNTQQEVPSNSLVVTATTEDVIEDEELEVVDSEEEDELVDYGEDSENDDVDPENYEDDPSDDYMGMEGDMSRNSSGNDGKNDKEEGVSSHINAIAEKSQGSPEKAQGGPDKPLDVVNASPGLSGGRSVNEKELGELKAAYDSAKKKNLQLVAKNFEPTQVLAHIFDKPAKKQVEIGDDEELDTESTAQNYVNAAGKGDLSPKHVDEHKKKARKTRAKRDTSAPPAVGGVSTRRTVSKTSGRQ